MVKQGELRGESYRQILSYWAPELVSSAVLYTLPILLDSFIVSQLGSISTYGILGVANNFLHMFTKFAEAFPVATMTLVGAYNGAHDYKKVGQTLGDAFWTTLMIGFVPFIILLLFASEVYTFLAVPPHMIAKGLLFLRLRALGVLLSFVYLAFFAFMKGIKNTKTPMKIFITGMVAFVICDYILVLGKFGFPQLGLTGSAIATIVQYSVMIVLCLWHVLRTEEYKKYFSKTFFYLFDRAGAFKIVTLSLPIVIDKASLSYAYIHLASLINPMGKYAIASVTLVKDLERFAFLPAVAFATIITFLVSNRLGARDPQGARANIKKVLKLGGAMVFTTLGIISLNPEFFAQIFDTKHKFAGFVGSVFPIISVLVVFDFIQLILCGALRGAGDVQAVMAIRFIVVFLFFIPLSSWLATLPIEVESVKFIVLYGSFYVSTGLIGLLCIARIKYKKWDHFAG